MIPNNDQEQKDVGEGKFDLFLTHINFWLTHGDDCFVQVVSFCRQLKEQFLNCLVTNKGNMFEQEIHEL